MHNNNLSKTTYHRWVACLKQSLPLQVVFEHAQKYTIFQKLECGSNPLIRNQWYISDILKENAKNIVKLKKEMWEKAKFFDKIISFKDKPINGDRLENDVASILASKGYLTFRNPILANEDLSFKKEVDIYATKDGKEIIIECTEAKNCIKWANKAELLSEISNELKCDVIFVSKQISEFGKKVLKTRGVLYVRVEELMRHI